MCNLTNTNFSAIIAPVTFRRFVGFQFVSLATAGSRTGSQTMQIVVDAHVTKRNAVNPIATLRWHDNHWIRSTPIKDLKECILIYNKIMNNFNTTL